MEIKKKYVAYLALAACLVAAVLGLLFYYGDRVAEYTWQKYRNPELSLFFVRKDADLALFIGNYCFNGVIGAGDYNPGLAERAYEKAVSIEPNIMMGHYELARVYFMQADFSRALDEINKELENYPTNLRSLYVRGLIYAYAGNLLLAEEDFTKFIGWAPQEWAGYNDLAWVLEKEGKYKQAESELEIGLNKAHDATNNPWLWNSLGVAQLNLKEYADAKKSFTEALSLADKITSEEWAASYPGNDPATANDGLDAFKNAIKDNISKAESFM